MPNILFTSKPDLKNGKRFSENNSKISEKLLAQSSKADSNSISSTESDAIEVTDVPKKRATESTQSLATLGRAYGNNISRQNVLKASPRPQSTHDIKEPWHKSSKTESREYGDYFSWQSGLSFLETHRVSIIDSKGINHFFNEYMKKLQRCQIFERGHNVTPFASVRFELLNKACNGKSSRTNVVNESVESVVGVGKSHDSIHKNKVDTTKAKNLSVATLKTIELLRKFKSGKSIEADLLVSKKRGLVNNKKSGVGVAKSGSVANKNPDFSMDMRTTDGTKIKETVQQLQKLEKKLSVALLYGINHDSMKDLDFSDQKANVSQRSNSLTSQNSFFLQKQFLLPSENSATFDDGENLYFPAKRSVESGVSGRDKTRISVETLYRSEGSLKEDDRNIRTGVTRRKSG